MNGQAGAAATDRMSPSLRPDDGFLGGLLALKKIPTDLRPRIAPGLFEVRLQPVARAILAVADRFDGRCPPEAVLHEVLQENGGGGGLGATFNFGSLLERAAEPQDLPVLLSVLETRRAESKGGLRLTPLRDLLGEPEEEQAWLVDGRLPTSGLSLVAGKPKAGKSTLARCLALAVARGEAWLGFKATSGPVIYLALEEKRSEVRAHFKAMGAIPEDPIKVFIAPSPQDGLAQLREAAERERPALIIVDPLLKLIRVKDANDYAIVIQALEPLLTLARETGAHVLAVHHLGKGERLGGDGILGSTAIFAAVDIALFLKRSERYRSLSSIQRYGQDLEEITLALDPETRWVSAGPSRREADEAQAGELILEYLKPRSEPMEEGAIHEAVEGRNAVKVRALRCLVEARRVTRTGAGKRGDPYRYAVCTTLVPTYMWERENEKPETAVSADGQAKVSRSNENTLSDGHPDSRERESEALKEAEL